MSAADQIDRIAELAAEGKNNTEIGLELGLSRHSVRRARRKHGIPASEADVTKAPPLPSRLERAERAAEGAQTVTDRLLDQKEDLEAQVRRLHSLLAKKTTDSKFENRILATIEASMDRISPEDAVVRRPAISRAGAKTRGQEFVALMSDAHGGEVVDPEETGGISYDWDTAVRRIEHYRDTIIKFRDVRTYPVTKLWVPILGDMVSGEIHQELEVTNEMPVVEQAIEMGRVLYNVGLDLCDYFPEVEFVVMPGNHPRTKIKQSNKQRALHSMEYVMGQFVQVQAQRDPRAENLIVQVPKDLVKIIEVVGNQRIGLMHGDGVKSSSFAGIPFYGLKQRRDAIQSMLLSMGNKPINMFAMGHFHQFVHWDGFCHVIINGALKGGDEFSMANYLSMPDPLQVLLEYHPEHGLTNINRINFKHIQ